MKTESQRILSHFAAASLLALCAACAGSERLDPTPSKLQGDWTGEALIGLSWAPKNQPLPLELHIDADGRVSGTIGGAQLRAGFVASNRGDLGRALELATDYVLRGELEGVVAPNEPKPSKFLIAPFNWVETPGEEPHLWGSVTTWEHPDGGKNEIVGAHDMRLRRR